MPLWWWLLHREEQENLGGNDLDILWGRVCAWVLTSSAFRNSSFFAIYLDWPAAVSYLSVLLFLVGFGSFRSSFLWISCPFLCNCSFVSIIFFCC